MKHDFKKLTRPTNSPKTGQKLEGNSNTPPIKFNTLERPPEAPEEKETQAKEYRVQMEYREVLKTYQENIIKSEGLRRLIAQGANKGEDPYNLLHQAIECIYLLTSDKAFYEHVKAGLKIMHHNLGPSKYPLDEIKDIQDRVRRLEAIKEKYPRAKNIDYVISVNKSTLEARENLKKVEEGYRDLAEELFNIYLL